MAVAAADVKFYLSGGAANADKNASLGGIISSVEVTSGALANLFDNVSNQEAVAGDIEYRCFYVKNTHATDALDTVLAFIQAQPPSPGTEIAIGVDPAGVGNGSTTGVATIAADEDTAPAGVTFSTTPVDVATALAVGDLLASECAGLWVRRTITAGAAPVASDPTTIRINGTPV